jgi:hypothetical protein
MAGRLWQIIVLINYCGQRSTGSFYSKKSIVNILMFELSFLTMVVPASVIYLLESNNKFMISIIAVTYIYLIWGIFQKRIENNIDFEECEQHYISINKTKRIFYFFFMVFILLFSVLFMFFSMKLLVFIK